MTQPHDPNDELLRVLQEGLDELRAEIAQLGNAHEALVRSLDQQGAAAERLARRLRRRQAEVEQRLDNVVQAVQAKFGMDMP